MGKPTERSSSFDFVLPLISTVKQSIPSKELINRLSILQDKLSILDDNEIDLNDLKSIKQDLINPKLLHNTNASVQAIVSCCVSDILRIFAPNAPYTSQELSDLFQVFFKQFSKLTINSKDKYSLYPRYLYLLKRIAETKSIVLIAELPDAETLIEELFDTIYELSTKQNFPRELEGIVTDILSEIIAEAEIIPHNVMKLILNKFLKHIESNLVGTNITSPEFKFSLIVCENNIDKLSRIIAQYFSEILYPNTTNSEEKPADSMDKLNVIHRLSIQLWKYLPQLLSSVMALLDDELNADNDTIRILATETIGQMLGSINYSTSPQFKVNFFTIHKTTWQLWIKKIYDVNQQVRCKWVEQLPNILINNTYLTNKINEVISSSAYKCLLDTEEKVREAACSAIQTIPFNRFVDGIASKEIIEAFFQLIREKHSDIRETSIEIVSSIYIKSTELEEEGRELDCDPEIKKLILTIPNQVLSLIYINKNNISSAVDFAIFERLLPINEIGTDKRVDRIIKLHSNLDQKGKEAFIAINKRQQQVSQVIKTFLDTIELYNQTDSDKENNDEESDKKSIVMKLDKIINWFCVSFPEGYNTYACLERFYKLNRARFFNLIRICISSESDFGTIKNSMKELITKLSDPANIRLENEGKSTITTKDMLYNIKLLVYRGSPVIFNRSNVEKLIEYTKNLDNATIANELLEQISLINPDVFKYHLRSLIDLVVGESNESKANLLKTIYHFIKKYQDLYPQEISFNESLKRLAINGTPKEAKYDIKIIGLSNTKEILTASIITSIYPLDEKSSQFATHLSSLAEIFLIDRYAIIDKESDLTPFIIKEIFLQNRNINREEIDDKKEWINEEEIEHSQYSNLNEKLIAIRLFVNNLKSYAENDNEINTDEAKEKALPVIKLLMSFIGNNGEIVSKTHQSYPTPEPFKSKLRLTAGEYLLKLAKIPIYSETLTTSSIIRLTFLINDENYQVRARFLNNLQKKINNELISERFLSLMFFSAIEPNAALKNNVTMWLQSMFKRAESKHNIKFEKTLIRLIHTISHHEQFISLLEAENEENIIKAYTFASNFVIYYVNLIAKSENISLLYYLASRVKQFRDATISPSDYDAEDFENLSSKVSRLYKVSELSQLILKEYSDSKNWIIQTWPGKITLPIDLYTPMSSSKEAQSVVTKIFIPENIQIGLVGHIKKRLGGDNKRKAESNYITPAKKQKSNKSTSKSRTSKPVKKAKKIVEEPSEPIRKSSRTTSKISYKDQLESGDEEEEKDDEDEF
ncbi:unnamed protein product [Candida verbasci]|uniref:Sister chromatid cohesion protein PDS5 n=1 Tax=Candida verbasci TaxID=1227364 RepID=A0A9W4TUM7_9ASCO|nr:unnamed protein product [Candida verbasci]